MKTSFLFMAENIPLYSIFSRKLKNALNDNAFVNYMKKSTERTSKNFKIVSTFEVLEKHANPIRVLVAL